MDSHFRLSNSCKLKSLMIMKMEMITKKKMAIIIVVVSLIILRSNDNEDDDGDNVLIKRKNII